MAGLLRRATTRHCGYGCAGIRAFLAKRKYNGSANSGRSGLQENFQYADEMDPLDVVGENTELQHEQAVEKRELDWLKVNKIQ